MNRGIWLDPQLPDTDWVPPVSAFRTPGWVRALVVLLVVALIAGLLVVVGAFEERNDTLVSRRPGVVVTTGPFEITLDRVVAQRVQEYDDTWIWELELQGSVRNIWDESISYSMGEFGWMAWRQPGSQEIVIPDGFSTDNRSSIRVEPTGELLAAAWSGEAEQEPAGYLEVHMLDLEYTDNSLLGFGERTWNPADNTIQTFVPVYRLPDEPYQ